MNFRPIFFVNGILLLILAVSMMIPSFVDLAAGNDDWKAFAAAQLVTAFVGFSLILTNRHDGFRMSLKETFILTNSSWILIALFASLPFSFAQINLGFAQAFFESMSGLTTTGSTVIVGLDSSPPGLLLWRGMLQAFGGVGILIVALAILPMLQTGGMQIFKTQSFDIEKVLPSAQKLAVSILGIYVLFNIAGTILLYLCGMTWLEAAVHTMTALSTGGFSTSDQSIGHFDSPLIEYMLIIFMLLGGLPFALYLKAATRGIRNALFTDSQVRCFLSIIAILSSIWIIHLCWSQNYNPLTALRHALFAVTTLITTTGFATADYTIWGPFSIAMAFFITFLGGCSGSTAGGIKTFRLQILWTLQSLQIKKLIEPHGLLRAHYNNRVLSPETALSVSVFFFAYILVYILSSLALALTGLDFTTAFSGAATAINNVGPGLGSIIGPAGNFSTIPDTALWILSFDMYLGRLELLTVLVLLSPHFWRK